MTSIFGYIRTSRRFQERVPGMDPASQELQLRRAGVPLNCVHRDVGTTGTQERRGWHRLNGRLADGDTLVVVAIDRIGRRWPDTIRSICELRDRGVMVRSLADHRHRLRRDGPCLGMLALRDCCDRDPGGVGCPGEMMVDVLVCGAMALFLRRLVLTRENVHSWGTAHIPTVRKCGNARELHPRI